MNPLLIQCAHPLSDEKRGQVIAQSAGHFQEWTKLLNESEAQGLSPLLYHQLHRYALDTLPTTINRTLKLQYLRHRYRNQIQIAALYDILQLYQKVGIDVLVLKGAALCHLLYSDPALRPMSDIDLLVKPQDAIRAHQLLKQLGFTVPNIKDKWMQHHHLPEAQKQQDGIMVIVEIHHNVFHRALPVSMIWADTHRPFMPFSLGDMTAFTLSYEDMLWHLCHHAVILGEPFKLIYVADIVGFAEKFIDKIDWNVMHQHHDFIINTLALLGELTVLKPALIQRLELQEHRSTSQGIGIMYTGWPLIKISSKPKHLRTLIFDSFSVSDWWLRLHYGRKAHQSMWFCRYITHPIYLVKRALKRLLFQI